MIVCKKCGSGNWKQRFRCPIDPANDEFQCVDCYHKFKRYDPALQPERCSMVLFILWSETYGDLVIHGIFTDEAKARVAQQQRGTMWGGKVMKPRVFKSTLKDGEFELPDID